MANNKRQIFYANLRQKFMKMYWKDNDGTDIFLPNGFHGNPGKIYSYFCEQITHDGKVLDLGCGNGLMLRYLMARTPFKLIPYGVDLLKPSIRQAREVIHPKYKKHFIQGNIIDYKYRNAPFDFIFVSPRDICPTDMSQFIQDVVSACSNGGRLIFYAYQDVLRAYGYSWVGEFLGSSKIEIRRKNYPGVSFGIYDK